MKKTIWMALIMLSAVIVSAAEPKFTQNVAASFLGNLDASLLYGNVMNFDLSDMLQLFLKKYVNGDRMQLYKNEIKGIKAIDWDDFPQALIVSDKGIQCGPIEDKLTEIKSLLDFMNSRLILL